MFYVLIIIILACVVSSYSAYRKEGKKEFVCILILSFISISMYLTNKLAKVYPLEILDKVFSPFGKMLFG